MSRYHSRVVDPPGWYVPGLQINPQAPWSPMCPSDSPAFMEDFSACHTQLPFPACVPSCMQAQLQRNNAMPIFSYRRQCGGSFDAPKPLALVHPMPQTLVGNPLSHTQSQLCESSSKSIHSIPECVASTSHPDHGARMTGSHPPAGSNHFSFAGPNVLDTVSPGPAPPVDSVNDTAVSHLSSPGAVTPVSAPLIFQADADSEDVSANRVGRSNVFLNPSTSSCETSGTPTNSRKRSKVELINVAECQMGEQATVSLNITPSPLPLGSHLHSVHPKSPLPANSAYSLHPVTPTSTLVMDSRSVSGEDCSDPVSAQHVPVGQTQPMNPVNSTPHPSLVVSGNRCLRSFHGFPLLPPGAPLSYASAQANSLLHTTGFLSSSACILPSLYMEALSLTIWQFYTSIRQSKAKYARKVHLRNALHMVVSGVFKNAGLFIVGSSINGFGSDQSDMDMCLTVTSHDLQQKQDAFLILSQLLPPLRKCSFIRNLHLIRAKVPILKFRDTLTGVDCDLNVNNVVGIYNTHLLAMYTRIDWRVRPLGMFVKHWAQRMDIHDGSRGRLSTYPLLLMLIHYLQAACSPPVLPNLQAKFPKIFNYAKPLSELDMRLELPWSELRSNNPASLADLFVGFIHYYTNEFDFTRWAVSVRHGAPLPIDVVIRRLPPHEQAHTARSFKVFVEEPFCQSNAARSLYDDNVLSRIRQAFVKTYQALRSQRPLDSIWVTSAPEPS